MFLLSFMVLSCTDDDKDVMDESGGSQSLFFAEEGLMVSTTGGDVVATVNWSNTTWRIVYQVCRKVLEVAYRVVDKLL